MGHLWLIGMMGSGKSTVGRRASGTLGLPFIDTDEAIELSTERTIEDIFAEGEAVFRDLERHVIAVISRLDDHVIATGGGAILDESNLATMTESGTTILLDADIATLTDRLRRSTHRPLLTSAEDLATILDTRAALYSAAADVTVDVTDRSIEDIANEVSTCRTM